MVGGGANSLELLTVGQENREKTPATGYFCLLPTCYFFYRGDGGLFGAGWNFAQKALRGGERKPPAICRIKIRWHLRKNPRDHCLRMILPVPFAGVFLGRGLCYRHFVIFQGNVDSKKLFPWTQKTQKARRGQPGQAGQGLGAGAAGEGPGVSPNPWGLAPFGALDSKKTRL